MQIKTLQEDELPLLFHNTNTEGWDNEALHTTALFHAHTNDFFIAYKEKKLIGFIIAIKYSDKFGFISSFLVLKEFRGLGYGKEIFTFAVKHLECCQIALDSVVGKESLYKQYGFKTYFTVNTYKFSNGSVTLPHTDFKVVDFDKKLSLKNKDNYMKEMILSKSTNYRAIKHKKVISSFAMSFRYVDGYKLHIESENINEALTLFFTLVNIHKDGTAIYLQASPLSPMLEAIVELLKMKEHSRFTRMYNFVL